MESEAGVAISKRKRIHMFEDVSTVLSLIDVQLTQIGSYIAEIEKQCNSILNKEGVCYENIRTLCTGDRTN
mgnify:CR=1 FL=1